MTDFTDYRLTQTEGRPTPPARLLCGIVLALTFLTYSETLKFQFVHDDCGQIVDNPAVHSWRYLPQYFTSHVWAGVSPEQLGNYYRPLFLLWLRLNDMAFGMRAWAWHFTTVLVHLVVTWLVYLLALRVFADPLSAGVTALIFGVHPAHIEAVTWISGVTEPLLAMFLLSAFLSYIKKGDGPQKASRWMVLSLLLYVLAMLEKETALVLPLIVIAYELICGGERGQPWSWAHQVRRVRHALWSATPYLIPIPFYLLARSRALKGVSHVITPLPISTLIFTWPSLFWFWIKHLIWPVGLSTFYDLPSVSLPNFSNFTLPAVGVLLAALGLSWGIQRSRAVAFGAVWLVLPLLPLLDIRVFLLNDFAHDRYLYLPSVGLAVVVAAGLRRLPLGHASLRGKMAIQILAALVLAALLGFGTAYQSFSFENNWVFYQHNLRSAPNNKLAKVNLASLLGEKGDYGQAVQLYQQILRGDPGFWVANYNLGYTYYKLGRIDEAERYLLKAIQINPSKPDEYLYLGLTRFKMGRLDDGVAAIRRAIQIRPDGYGYHFALGVVLKVQGDLQGALAQFRAELAVNPQQSAARQQIAEIQTYLTQEHSRKAGTP